MTNYFEDQGVTINFSFNCPHCGRMNEQETHVEYCDIVAGLGRAFEIYAHCNECDNDEITLTWR